MLCGHINTRQVTSTGVKEQQFSPVYDFGSGGLSVSSVRALTHSHTQGGAHGEKTKSESSGGKSCNI